MHLISALNYIINLHLENFDHGISYEQTWNIITQEYCVYLDWNEDKDSEEVDNVFS